MSYVIPLNQISEKDLKDAGGKAVRLAVMAKHGLKVPRAACVLRTAYLNYLETTVLRERILFELNRKAFEEMRWEEIWDAALRIRNLFINTPLPGALRSELRGAIEPLFGNRPVVVRSSAESEDASDRSFAGLHDSYVGVQGIDSILEHVKLVWASLWSDRALLYRKELGLNIRESAMSVVVQEMQTGDSSGVVFSKSPLGEDHVVIEAVYGLNQGLVDGAVSPDRWRLAREAFRILGHDAIDARRMLVATEEGLEVQPVPAERASSPPLDPEGVERVHALAMQAEGIFKAPQDVEWTWKDPELYALQSRPITTIAQEDAEDDDRPWYLSLHRSFENLKALRRTIEEEVLPGMDAQAKDLARLELSALSDEALADEIEKRASICKEWRDVYWRDCIPFAHGMRLFGRIYNEKVKPSDPHEFMELLRNVQLAGLERNRRLERMAEKLRNDTGRIEGLRNADWEGIDPSFLQELDVFIADYGAISRPDAGSFQGAVEREDLVRLLIEMAQADEPACSSKGPDLVSLKKRYLDAFEPGQRGHAEELLELGRASYRLRDDDNIYLERVERQHEIALVEGRRRIQDREGRDPGILEPADVIQGLRDPSFRPAAQVGKKVDERPSISRMRPRQLVGQPAGPGNASGKARVIDTPEALFQFKRGEILVCDAIDPGMTFVVPLAAAVVERRGGMLIHGAIIAREYGLPCVTGVPDAVSLIRTGDRVAVDGYLGIVIVG
jgi:pyruvate,water dikinase